MTRRVELRWTLRQRLAENGMFATSDLVPLLAAREVHLSRSQVHRLVTTTPQRINLEVLAALCDILDCGPGDLLVPATVATEQPRRRRAAAGEGAGVGDLRPTRATLRRPHTG